MTIPFFCFILVAVLFDFLNGLNDSANIVSTMIASRALSPRQARLLAAIAEFVGPFLFGVAVAKTIGAGVVALPASSSEAFLLVFSALITAVGWGLITWRFGIPSSSSHAIIGSIIGAALANSAYHRINAGIHSYDDMVEIFSVIKVAGLLKVLTTLLVSPGLGFVAGYFVTKFCFQAARDSKPSVAQTFKKGQLLTAIALALSYGANDAQKTMGIITMGLVATGRLGEFNVPLWVVALSAGTIALGTVVGSQRVARTMGRKFFKIRSIDGFATQASSAMVILGAALFGGPVSTTQVVTSSIMGVGTAERISKVRWGVGKQIVITWFVTIPGNATFATLVFLLVRRFI